MAIAFVQEIAAAGTPSGSTTLTLNVGATVTVGNHLIISIVRSAGATVSVSDSQSNTWQEDLNVNTGNARMAIFSCKVATALTTSDTITVTTSSASNTAASVQEWSGLATSTWLDKTASATGTAGTASDSGATATTAQADELLVGMCGHVSTVSSFAPESLSPAWTERTTAASSSTVRTIRPFTRVVSATGAYSAKATWTTARDWGALIATYKASADSGQTISGVGAIASAEAIGTAQLNLQLSLTGLASAEAIGSHTLSPQPVTVTLEAVASAEAIGTLSIGQGLTLSGVASGEAIGTAQLDLSLALTGVASGEAVGSHTVSPQPVTLTLSGVASGEVVGTARLDLGLSLTGLASAEAIGTLTLSPQPVTLTLSALASGEAIGALTVTGGVQVVVSAKVVLRTGVRTFTLRTQARTFTLDP